MLNRCGRVFRDRRNALDNKSVKDCVSLNGRRWGSFQVLLFIIACLGVAVTENEVNLVQTIQNNSRETVRGAHTLVPGQVRSGPNMIVHGVLSLNSPSDW